MVSVKEGELVTQIQIQVQIDLQAQAAYVGLSDNVVSRTVEVTPQVLVDLDEMAVVVGVEVLALDAVIPLSELESAFHVHSDAIAALALIRPSVGSYFHIGHGGDGESSATRVGTVSDGRDHTDEPVLAAG